MREGERGGKRGSLVGGKAGREGGWWEGREGGKGRVVRGERGREGRVDSCSVRGLGCVETSRPVVSPSKASTAYYKRNGNIEIRMLSLV